jgi:glucokinase
VSGAPAPVLGVDLGGTNMRVAVVAAGGEIVSRSVVPTPQDDPGALGELMREVAAGLATPPRGAVVGVPAVVDYERGEALRIPNIPRWEGKLGAQSLADATGLPVLFANDADLAAVGEHRYGAGRGASDMVYVTISTGVGAGVILGDRLVHGRRSLAEVGHTVIDYRGMASEGGGTVEGLGSGTTLGRISGLDGAEVTRRAQAGDAEALAWFEQVVAAFATGVANLVEMFMPERVVIGGGVSQAGGLLLNPVREHVARSHARELLAPEAVVLASGGDDVGLRGTYALWEDCETPQPAASRLAPFEPAR